jgi:hypothetical protein
MGGNRRRGGVEIREQPSITEGILPQEGVRRRDLHR